MFDFNKKKLSFDAFAFSTDVINCSGIIGRQFYDISKTSHTGTKLNTLKSFPSSQIRY